MKKVISVVMPTYNSGPTLKSSLDSIKNQNFKQNLIEILIIDGGSKDDTIKIARAYGCKIILNRRANPEYAKYIAIRKATGKYLFFLDSDEVMENNHSLSKRVKAMSEYGVKILFSGGFKAPQDSSLANKYVSLFADPFSYFIYGISPDASFLLNDYLNKYPRHKIYEDFVIFEISADSPLPLLDTAGGVMIHRGYLKSVFPRVFDDPSLFSQITYKLMRESKSITILKNDATIHESVNSLQRYLFKLRWKVKVNVVFKNNPSTGFSKRESYQNKAVNFKKFLFLPYAFTLIGPIIVGLHFFVFRKRPAAILHPLLTYYVAACIVYYSLVNYFGIEVSLPILGNSAPKKDYK